MPRIEFNLDFQPYGIRQVGDKVNFIFEKSGKPNEKKLLLATIKDILEQYKCSDCKLKDYCERLKKTFGANVEGKLTPDKTGIVRNGITYKPNCWDEKK